MPTRPAKPCRQPGCPALAKAGSSYCEQHTRDAQRQYDVHRGSAAKRGYGRRWEKLRRMVLNRNPLCADPFGAHGDEPVAADVVDHIVPKSRGGSDDMDNLQALCYSCHNRKTRQEQAGDHLYARVHTSTIPVTIVAGPPGSGKTTWVRERARWGDLVVDVDALYHALSGLPRYDKPQGLLPFVIEARDAVILRLARNSDVRHAWLITGEANRTKLDRLCSNLGGELVVLNVSPSECIRRISQDERRSNRLEQWTELVNKWWDRFNWVGGIESLDG